MKVVVFEGIDCTGKSTKVNELVRNNLDKNVKVVHVDGKCLNTLKWYLNIIVLAKSDKVDLLIFDRFALGELVYGNSLRESSRIDLLDVSGLVDSFVDELHFTYVDDWSEYIDMYFKREKVNPDVEHFKRDQGHFKTIVDLLVAMSSGTDILIIKDKFC